LSVFYLSPKNLKIKTGEQQMNKFSVWFLMTFMFLAHSVQVSAFDLEADKNIKKGQKFLNKNRKDKSVIEKISGLQYQILVKGNGTVRPKNNDRVTAHYHGSFLNGDIFDSSKARGRPITFNLNQVIKGWKKGIKLMVVGDKFRFFIPSHLAYGNQKVGQVPPGSLLIFEIELLAINP